MEVIGIVDENVLPKSERRNLVSGLIWKVDCVLSEQGFARGKKRFDGETGENYIVYDGTEGWAVVRFGENGELIPFIVKEKVVSECQVYVDLKEVPKSVAYSIREDLKRI